MRCVQGIISVYFSNENKSYGAKCQKKKNEIKAKYEIPYAFKLFVLSSGTPRFYKMFTDETSMHIFSVVSGSKI